MTDNFQRIGSKSNAHAGRDFEQTAQRVLSEHGLVVQPNFPVQVGVGENFKPHSFDLGSSNPPVIVECKSHRWTTGNNVPSAKITVWNEAMYYFECAQGDFRKIFFVLKDQRKSSGETLAAYYLRNYGHLVPNDVEFWEYDEDEVEVKVIHGGD